MLLLKAILDAFLNKISPLGIFKEINLDYKNIDNKFLQWFVGFTDSEGTFVIQTKNNSEVNFCFKITLHIYNSAVLYLIKEK